MSLDLFSVTGRIKAIIETDMPYTEVFDTFVDPTKIDTALFSKHVVVLHEGIFDSPFISGGEGQHNIPFDMYWYISSAISVSKEKDKHSRRGVLQDFINTFMSRPRLHLNDSGLKFVRKIRVIPLTQPPARTLTYPPNYRANDAKLYNGFVSRLIIPYHTTYEMKA